MNFKKSFGNPLSISLHLPRKSINPSKNFLYKKDSDAIINPYQVIVQFIYVWSYYCFNMIICQSQSWFIITVVLKMEVKKISTRRNTRNNSKNTKRKFALEIKQANIKYYDILFRKRFEFLSTISTGFPNVFKLILIIPLPKNMEWNESDW